MSKASDIIFSSGALVKRLTTVVIIRDESIHITPIKGDDCIPFLSATSKVQAKSAFAYPKIMMSDTVITREDIMDAHTALALLEVNVLQFAFANDLVTNHDSKELPVCNGICVKIAICNFRSVDIFIIMTDSGIVLKILVECMAHLAGHGF